MSIGAESFAAYDAILEGRWDDYLPRLHQAIHQRQATDEYRARVVERGRIVVGAEETEQ